MQSKLDEALVKDFPDLYKDRNASMQTTCMCWGFECGDGWEPLIRDLSKKLTELAKMEKIDVYVVQVKEKFGTLHFYVNNSTDIMDDVISYAENRSAFICELCGKDGSLNDGPWFETRCEEHTR